MSQGNNYNRSRTAQPINLQHTCWFGAIPTCKLHYLLQSFHKVHFMTFCSDMFDYPTNDTKKRVEYRCHTSSCYDI